MPVFHTHQSGTIGARSTVAHLQASLTTLRAHHEAGEDFERFERAVHTLFVDAEREVLGEELERLDVDLPSVVIGGHVHHRVLRSAETYTSAVGPVTVMRTLYRRRHRPVGHAARAAGRDGGRSLDAVGGETGDVGGGSSHAWRRRGPVRGAGQHAAVEE